MKKLTIVKSIFWVWFVLLSCFGVYCLYYLFERADKLSEKYVELNKGKEYNILFYQTLNEFCIHLDDKFRWSLIALLIVYILLLVFVFVFYIHFRNLVSFYICNEETTGFVYVKDYRFNLRFDDLKDNTINNHSQRNQLLYKKIYLKRDGEIDIFYDKFNSKRFIIGNKATFLVESFLKPFFLDLFIFICTFGLIYFLHPFLFLSVL